MYKLETVLKDIGSQRGFIENFLVMDVPNEKRLKVFDLELFDEKWELVHDSHSYNIYKDNIIAGNLSFYNTNKELLYSNPFDYKLNISSHNEEGASVLRQVLKWEKIGTKFNFTFQHHIFNLNTKEFIKQNILNLPGGVVFIKSSLLVLRAKEGRLIIYDYELDKIVWERDFSEECAYIDPIRVKETWRKGEIGQIYQYADDKLIITAGKYHTFCLDLKTGEQLWTLGFTATFILTGDEAFAYTNGGSIAKIDLKTGEILNSNGKFHKLPDLPQVSHERLGDIHISAHGSEMIYHDNSLWYLVHSNGYSFVVKINPDTFAYEWIHQVDTVEEIRDIKFYKDRMYLYDLGYQLHVYTKQ
ncbi:PQQ-binding-like beta-propeller repeat protein [uncultured Psychroserpens sp.]|uniref:outer membrane protein assembly factor BamB family protein n=1 Tax=uncultured Psychroserpens sp. TaxID=255436 RepID=UPI0026266FF6|nr:PQQ-binding-like beta-propeller repeat protein [uncultured Psychroserpens sp.]